MVWRFCLVSSTHMLTAKELKGEGDQLLSGDAQRIIPPRSKQGNWDTTAVGSQTTLELLPLHTLPYGDLKGVAHTCKYVGICVSLHACTWLYCKKRKYLSHMH